MKKFVFVLLAFSLSLSAQESVIDTLEIQNLEEIIVSSVRVKDNIPIAFNNVSKEEISKRNLGQDIPILLNFLPNVVTTSDAGAGIGYTGIRIRGVNSQSTNVTINGIPYNDAESLGTFGLIYLIFLHLLKIYKFKEEFEHPLTDQVLLEQVLIYLLIKFLKNHTSRTQALLEVIIQ